MNLLVTILSLTPAVGAVFRLLEERPKTRQQPQKVAKSAPKRRDRRRKPRRATRGRFAAWRSPKLRNPLRALRAP
jgi:hypothetical protein